jgi:hypothetical protein
MLDSLDNRLFLSNWMAPWLLKTDGIFWWPSLLCISGCTYQLLRSCLPLLLFSTWSWCPAFLIPCWAWTWICTCCISCLVPFLLLASLPGFRPRLFWGILPFWPKGAEACKIFGWAIGLPATTMRSLSCRASWGDCRLQSKGLLLKLLSSRLLSPQDPLLAPGPTSDRSFEVVSSAASEVVAPRFPEHRHQIAASFDSCPVCLLDLASRFPGGRHRSCSISSEGRIERA